MRVLVAGDTHEDQSKVLLHQDNVDAFVFLGDQTPKNDFKSLLGKAAQKTWFVLGNHDSDKQEFLDRHHTMMHQCLHCRVVEMGGLKVAGLNGVFARRFLGLSNVDRLEDLYSVKAFYHTRDDWKRCNQPCIECHTSIFPEDIERMKDIQADVLVCHEAPECHCDGFQILGDLARIMGVKLLIHGHHHERYEAEIEGGIKVLGLGVPGTIDSVTGQDQGVELLHHAYPWQIS